MRATHMQCTARILQTPEDSRDESAKTFILINKNLICFNKWNKNNSISGQNIDFKIFICTQKCVLLILFSPQNAVRCKKRASNSFSALIIS